MSWRVVARAALGAAAGYAIWRMSWRAEAAMATPLVNALLHFSSIRVGAADGIITIASQSGRGLGTVRFDLLTFNFIALCALFAATLRLHRLARATAAVIALFFVHVLALLCTVEATALVSRVSRGEDVSAVAWNTWTALSQGYQVVGAYALVFALWWFLGDGADLLQRSFRRAD